VKKRLVITDLTRMQAGRVCVAGYDEQGICIRPVLPPPGILESSLLVEGKPVVFPFAIVEYELLQSRPQPPHTEDYFYDPARVRFIRRVEEKNRPKVFQWSLFDSVSAIFEEPIHTDPGHYILDGRGPRSLGTILPRVILRAIYEPGDGGKYKYRLRFIDGDNAPYGLSVTDLAWRYHCDAQRKQGREPGEIASHLTSTLKSSTVYLRIGLARGWVKFPDRCYLQITGVHTVPDYLQGKTFADLATIA